MARDGKSSNFFSLPTWQSMLGAIITAIAVGLLINPTILVYQKLLRR